MANLGTFRLMITHTFLEGTIFEKLNKFEKVLFYVKTGIFRKIDELLNFETPILRIFRAYLGAEWLHLS